MAKNTAKTTAKTPATATTNPPAKRAKGATAEERDARLLASAGVAAAKRATAVATANATPAELAVAMERGGTVRATEATPTAAVPSAGTNPPAKGAKGRKVLTAEEAVALADATRAKREAAERERAAKRATADAAREARRVEREAKARAEAEERERAATARREARDAKKDFDARRRASLFNPFGLTLMVARGDTLPATGYVFASAKLREVSVLGATEGKSLHVDVKYTDNGFAESVPAASVFASEADYLNAVRWSGDVVRRPVFVGANGVDVSGIVCGTPDEPQNGTPVAFYDPSERADYSVTHAKTGHVTPTGYGAGFIVEVIGSDDPRVDFHARAGEPGLPFVVVVREGADPAENLYAIPADCLYPMCAVVDPFARTAGAYRIAMDLYRANVGG